MSDEDLKRAVVDAALRHAASDGFSTRVLEKAAAEAGASEVLPRLFPGGVGALLSCYSHQVDAEMLERLAAAGLSGMPLRKRIRTAVLTRLDILAPHKQAAKRAAAYLAFPANGPLAAALVYDTVDAMWRAAGDTSTDIAWYTKRASLAAVYTATLMRWFADPSREETEAFLDARIENVMQYEKLKARVRDGARTGFDRVIDLMRR